jgi:hypothetical protein
MSTSRRPQIVHLSLIDGYCHLVGDDPVVTITVADLSLPNEGVKKDYYIMSNNLCVYTMNHPHNAINIDRLSDYRMFIHDTLFCCPDGKLESINQSTILGYLPHWKKSLHSSNAPLIAEIEQFLREAKNLDSDLSNITNFDIPDDEMEMEMDQIAFLAKPQPSQSSSKPQPSQSSAKPQPSQSSAKPQPSSAKPQPQPSSAKPQPSQSSAKPQPSSAKPQLQPSSSSFKPRSGRDDRTRR